MLRWPCRHFPMAQVSFTAYHLGLSRYISVVHIKSWKEHPPLCKQVTKWAKITVTVISGSSLPCHVTKRFRRLDFTCLHVFSPCLGAIQNTKRRAISIYEWNIDLLENMEAMSSESQARSKSSAFSRCSLTYYLVHLVLVVTVTVPTIFYIFQPDHPPHNNINE